MRIQHAVRGGHHPGRLALVALPVAALALTACGQEEPEVEPPPATQETSDEPTSEEPTSEEPTTEPEPSEEPTAEEPTEEPSEEPTAEEPTTEPEPSEEPTETDTPDEGAEDGQAFAERYVDAVAAGDAHTAYGMLSPEALTYYPDVSVFEQAGIAGLSEDLAASTLEPTMAIRSAYEESYDGAQVVSVWGEDDNGDPYAHAFAIRQLDGLTWVVDQEITPSTGQPRLNWLNPGIQEGIEEWAINRDQPISFALLKHAGPNTAVTASINEGSEVSQQLTELPTDGAVIYELSDSELNDGFSIVTASWVAEDAPFIHTSATPAGYSRIAGN